MDVIVELGAEKLLAIEVKASAAPRASDASHLLWLAERLGERFLGGLVLHTGPRAYVLGPRIVAAPIAALWE